MKPIITFTLLIFLMSTCLLAQQKRKLIWSDEFNYTGLPDSTKWSYDVGGEGWGNQELQFYTKNRLENARVENGKLTIEARKEAMDTCHFTSARLVTRGKKEFTYGRFEIRARLPKAVGSWPAIWMLGTNIDKIGWPECGEIDIMEHVGHDVGRIHASVHTKAYYHSIGTQKTGNLVLKDISDTFHTYTMDWKKNKIDFYIDDILYFSFKKESDDVKVWPFAKPCYLLLNVAVGGFWGGQKGIDETAFPQKMEIDWVRVYK